MLRTTERKEVFLLNKNSMLFWHPYTEVIDIPQPKTKIVRVDQSLSNILEGHPLPNYLELLFKEKAKEIGYPLFLRTDFASAKHDWKNTCFVPSEDRLINHIAQVVEFNDMAGIIGLPYQAIIFREYIPLESSFRAFKGEMPVAKERRYFIKDGEVKCHHPYWEEGAVAKSSILPENWQELLSQLNQEDEEEVSLLTSYARQLGQVLEGYWSVDFAKGKDGKWYFIDAALGEQSWHPECDFVDF